MITGRIIEAKNDFFYVQSDEQTRIYVCKLRGRFKSKAKGTNVYPGDRVRFTLLPEGAGGIIEELLPRRNLLHRPAVANVDQAIVVVAAREPDFNPLLLDRFLALAEHIGDIKIIIAVNKIDLLGNAPAEYLLPQYEKIGYNVAGVSAMAGDVAAIKNLLGDGLTTVFFGASGVGKSSLINALLQHEQGGGEAQANLAVSEISGKIKRGRHTTRSVRLLPCAGGFVADTPGFSAVDLSQIDKQAVPWLFNEFAPYNDKCRFSPCSHSHEPDCAVKAAVATGAIEPGRYASYLDMLENAKR